MKLLNQKQALVAIAGREDFIASSLRGQSGRSNTYGRLDPEEIAEYEKARDTMDYVVISYSTPVAWHSSLGWYAVKRKFSNTTSRHQGIIRRAISGWLS